jgi:hypothetical protein
MNWLVLTTALAFALIVPPVSAQSLIKNGSFEDGETATRDWQLMPGGSLVREASHHGARHLHGESAPEAVVCTSALAELVPGVEYRMEGCLRSPMGPAHLEIRAVSANLLDPRLDRLQQILILLKATKDLL